MLLLYRLLVGFTLVVFGLPLLPFSLFFSLVADAKFRYYYCRKQENTYEKISDLFAWPLFVGADYLTDLEGGER